MSAASSNAIASSLKEDAFASKCAGFVSGFSPYSSAEISSSNNSRCFRSSISSASSVRSCLCFSSKSSLLSDVNDVNDDEKEEEEEEEEEEEDNHLRFPNNNVLRATKPRLRRSMINVSKNI